jgi:hypothetical protein
MVLLIDCCRSTAASLFAPDGPAVRDFQLRVTDASARSLRTQPRTYVRAELRVDGSPVQEIGVHLKGATGSFRPFDDRPSLTLDLDRFHPGQALDGLTKLHLNNSVEDPSRLCEMLGHELFARAGLLSPRVAHARVRLNGRDLGLYVLKEGFTAEFLRRAFPGVDGTLLEPQPVAPGQTRWRVDARTGTNATANIDALLAAAATPDLAARWDRLGDVLERTRFADLLAAEVLLAHRDGYALAGNNFRVLLAGDGRATFLPHGIDQLFAGPDLPLQPQFAGPVARAFAETPAGRAAYADSLHRLRPQLLDVPALTNRIAELARRLQPALAVREWTEVRAGAAELTDRVVRRGTSVDNSPAPPPLRWDETGTARLEHWTPEVAPAGAQLTPEIGPEQVAALRILAGPKTTAAWRTTLELPPGRYRFTAQVATRAVVPLPFGRNHGAALRLVGQDLRVGGLLGTQPWRPLELEFAVAPAAPPVELRLELRAAGGEAWFARDSLRLQRSP